MGNEQSLENSKEQSASRGVTKVREGKVVSSKMDKSVVVLVSTKKKHRTYQKFVSRSVRYIAHDKDNSCGEGDVVRIVETRPLSKTKRWRVQEILHRAE